MSEARAPRWRVDLDVRGWVVCLAVLGIVVLGDLASRLKIDAVQVTDLLEDSRAECPSQGTAFQAPVGAWSIETFKLIRDPK